MNYKNTLGFYTGLILLATSSLHAQQPIRCATPQLTEQYEQRFPGAKLRMAEAENAADEWVKSHSENTRSVIIIPVVVHVVYHTAAQNISDERVQSQIDVLNEDFTRQNADTVNSPDAFQSVAGNCMIEFCLAAFDPNGDSTSGITRTFTDQISFDTGSDIHFTSQGGEDAWPSEDYLNIWVANLGGNILGYGTLPGQSNSEEDGVVVLHKAFGRYSSSTYPYNLGRTCTHEVGHWLDMKHVWGDDNGSCSGSDGMPDTPNQADWTFDCPPFPLVDACSPDSPGVMFMNYMDYTDDGCMNMFTQDQAEHMRGVLETSRNSIQTSPAGCQGVHYNNDAAVIKILVPADTLDAESFQPQIQIANRGLNTLTSLQLFYQSDGQQPAQYTFTGSLETNQSVVITLPLYFTGEGDHIFTSWCSSPNNTTDEYIYNDTTTQDFTVISTIQKNTVIIGVDEQSPTSGHINISVLNPGAGDLDLRIVNTIGQVMEHHFITLSTQTSVNVDLSHLSNGIYFLYAKIGFDYLTKKVMVCK